MQVQDIMDGLKFLNENPDIAVQLNSSGDTSQIPQVPISSMTGIPSGLRKTLDTINNLNSPVTNYAQPGIGESGSLPIPPKAAIPLAVASALPWGAVFRRLNIGSWIDSEGNSIPTGDLSHVDYLKQNTNFKDIDGALKAGWIRQRGSEIELKDINNPNLAQALYKAKESSNNGYVSIFNMGAGINKWEAVAVPSEDFGELLSNPNNYVKGMK